jgi:hypothetical protein
MKEHGQFQNHRCKPSELPFSYMHQEHDPSGQVSNQEASRQLPESSILEELTTFVDEECKQNSRINGQPTPLDIGFMAYKKCEGNSHCRYPEHQGHNN